MFDLNDFDETLPGPFEYDVKRMAASFTIAARNNGFTEPIPASVTLASVAAYRAAMVEFAGMPTMDVWHARLSEQDIMSAIAQTSGGRETARRRRRRGAPRSSRPRRPRQGAHPRQPLGAVEARGTGRRPVPHRLPTTDRHPCSRVRRPDGISADEIQHRIHTLLRAYRATLQHDRRHLLEEFELVDVARKVVGVGSVGTRAYIGLLQGRDQHDPLFLQVKEATRSVLEDHLPKSRYRQPGERVVHGQRMMQAASDIFLGWTKGIEDNRYLYLRQLRDMKGSVDVEVMRPFGLSFYAGICGQTLARAHARSGDPVAMAAYLGKTAIAST